MLYHKFIDLACFKINIYPLPFRSNNALDDRLVKGIVQIACLVKNDDIALLRCVKKVRNKQFFAINAVGTYMDTYNRSRYQEFLADGELKVQTLGRGFAWLDTGTHDSLSEASTYIEVLEKRQGLKVACLEGIAYRQGWISEERMRELAQPMLKNQYGQYLLKVIDELKETGKPNLG